MTLTTTTDHECGFVNVFGGKPALSLSGDLKGLNKKIKFYSRFRGVRRYFYNISIKYHV